MKSHFVIMVWVPVENMQMEHEKLSLNLIYEKVYKNRILQNRL